MKAFRIFLLFSLLGFSGRPVYADTYTLLHSFTDGADGGQTTAGLVGGFDGYFYGVAPQGGSTNAGVVFKISSAGTFTTLYSFTGGADGAGPNTTLVQGTDSNFYGVTTSTMFKIAPSGTLTTLCGASGNRLIQATDGNFYGTITSGGSHLGEVFRLTPQGTLTTLYSFTGGIDGGYPYGALVQGNDGNFYGTTDIGGSHSRGSIYKMTPSGNLTHLYSFTFGADGAYPMAGLVLGRDGNLYGTAYDGGNGFGTIFRITPSGAFTLLHEFTGSDGDNPGTELIQASDGNFYGVTLTGGGSGNMFQMTPAGVVTTLYNFTGGADGFWPQAPLVEGSDGSFYSTTPNGGTNGNEGTIFKISVSVGTNDPGCVSIDSTNANFAASGGSGSFNVTTLGGCPWTVINASDFIIVTSDGGGDTNGTLSYQVGVNNTMRQRASDLTVNGHRFTVSQEPFDASGAFYGLVLQNDAPTPDSSGAIQMSFKPLGMFSAKVTVGGVPSTFTGQIDASGAISNTVNRSGRNPLAIALHVDATGGTNIVKGTLSDGTFTSTVVMDNASFSKSNPCPWVGRYRFVLAPAVSQAYGYGYGTLIVASTGVGRMQGVLGNGVKINVTAPALPNGLWPLYNTGGPCIGWVTLPTTNVVQSSVVWWAPFASQGASSELTLTLYDPPSTGSRSIIGSGTITLSGGLLYSNIVKNISIDVRGNVNVSPPGDDLLKLKVQPQTGQISGTFWNSGLYKHCKLSGQLLPSAGIGGGYFSCASGTVQTGNVLVHLDP